MLFVVNVVTIDYILTDHDCSSTFKGENIMHTNAFQNNKTNAPGMHQVYPIPPQLPNTSPLAPMHGKETWPLLGIVLGS